MNFKTTFLITIALCLFVLPTVLSYPVTFRIQSDVTDFNVDTYDCSNSACSILSNRQTHNSGSNTYVDYVVDGSGAKYTAEFTYKENSCGLPYMFISSTDDSTGAGPWTFDEPLTGKEGNCKAPAKSLSAPSEAESGDLVIITAEIYSPKTLDPNGPQTLPNELKNVYAMDVKVYLIIEDPSGHESTIDSETVRIPYSETETVAFSWHVPNEEGTYDITIKTEVTDCKCSSQTPQFRSQSIAVGEGSTPGDTELDLGYLEVDPNEVCYEDDERIELSIDVELEEGDDNTNVRAKFYIEDNDGDWEFIDDEQREMDEGEEKTFNIYYYDSEDLDRGTHDVKVVVTAGGESETRYSELEVERCNGDDFDLDVGFIRLRPEHPEKDDIVFASVPITLEDADDYPAIVRVKVYIDNELLYTSSLRYRRAETKTYDFTFDADDYSNGRHEIKVRASIDDVSDISERDFWIGDDDWDDDYYCLSIDKVWVEGDLQPGETVEFKARLTNCGTEGLEHLRIRVKAFDRFYYSSYFDLWPGDTKDVSIRIQIPEDVFGPEIFEMRIWNSDLLETYSKTFNIYDGIPILEVNSEYRIGICKSKEIEFDILNAGQVEDAFTVNITGPGSEWIVGYPVSIALDAGERNTMKAYVSMPCDAEEGYYQFTISTWGSPKTSVISTLKVVKPFTLPLWVILILLALLLLLLLILLLLNGGKTKRKNDLRTSSKPENSKRKFPKFDDCC